MAAGHIFLIFFAVWMALGITSFLLFYLGRNVSFKRRYYPWSVGLAGVLFLGFMAAMRLPFPFLALATPFVVLITYLNLRGTRFCGACGRTITGQNPFSTPEFCSKCGASLRDETGA